MKKLLCFYLALAVAMAACSKDDDMATSSDDDSTTGESGVVLLNEINGTGTDAEKYIELYNTSDDSICLKGYAIYYNNFSSDAALSWKGTRADTIAGKGYYLLRGVGNAGNTDHALATGLSATQGIVVELRDTDDETADVFVIEADAARNSTYARIPDGTGIWYLDDASGTAGSGNGSEAGTRSKIVNLPWISAVTLTPERPTPGDVVNVTISVLTSSAIIHGEIQWTLDGEDQDEIGLSGSRPTFTAQFPEQMAGSVVEFTVTVGNTEGGFDRRSGNYTVTTGEGTGTEGRQVAPIT